MLPFAYTFIKRLGAVFRSSSVPVCSSALSGSGRQPVWAPLCSDPSAHGWPHYFVTERAEGEHVLVSAILGFFRRHQAFRDDQMHADGGHVLDCIARDVLVNRGQVQVTATLLALNLFPALAQRGLRAEDQAGRWASIAAS